VTRTGASRCTVSRAMLPLSSTMICAAAAGASTAASAAAPRRDLLIMKTVLLDAAPETAREE
jgi:hypothetical protein